MKRERVEITTDHFCDICDREQIPYDDRERIYGDLLKPCDLCGKQVCGDCQIYIPSSSKDMLLCVSCAEKNKEVIDKMKALYSYGQAEMNGLHQKLSEDFASLRKLLEK